MSISFEARGSTEGRFPPKSYYPLATIKCTGPSVFRSQCSRDVACLLDVDAAVESWFCMPEVWSAERLPQVPDFGVFPKVGNPYYVDAPDRDAPIVDELRCFFEQRPGRGYKLISEQELQSGFRLRNAKDLLRYGNHRTTLADRVRLLAALDENGSLSFADCLSAFAETKPVAGLASLILNGYVEVDLDQGPLGPETIVRRLRP